ncbi:MAG: transglycosylase family protein [Acidimicrobiales bacterium]
MPVPPPSPPTTPTVDGVPALLFSAWSKVNACEEGGSWAPAGSAYPDGLGISAANWSAYGGGSDHSPAAQILVAQRIEAAAGTPGYVPDQAGCASW